jgi:hypothetical protein
MDIFGPKPAIISGSVRNSDAVIKYARRRSVFLYLRVSGNKLNTRVNPKRVEIHTVLPSGALRRDVLALIHKKYPVVVALLASSAHNMLLIKNKDGSPNLY